MRSLAAVAGVLGLALTSATDAAEQARRPQDRSWRGTRARVARRGRGRRGRGARPSTGPRDASVWVTPRPAGSAAQRVADACHGRGVLHRRLDECRCSAGWAGRWCEERDARRCNAPVNPRQDLFNRESLCAGHCDEDRGICYCAGLATPTQRPLPFQCRPEAHLTTRLPDGRPAYPALTQSGRWEMARVYFETDRASPDYGWHAAGSRPFDHIYGEVAGNPRSRHRRPLPAGALPFCSPLLHEKKVCYAGCPEGRTGPLCEARSRSFCLRDCSGRGRCDAGFCWCDAGWFGIDCSEHAAGREAPRLQQQQRLPSPAARSQLRLYVYDMPSEFTTRNLQWRGAHAAGLSRAIDPASNQSYHNAGSLYAMELALHEWLLDSPLRTADPAQAHLYYVPVYLSSLFMYPIVKYADAPYYGRSARTFDEGGDASEPTQRSQQGTLLLLRALRYIQGAYPFWNASGGADHVWLMLHDEGPCFAPRAIRPSILLTHYGYWAASPRAWGTFDDDHFLRFPGFYRRYLGDDPRTPGACFTRGKDLVISPWKTPTFWLRQLRSTPPAAAERPGLAFFAGDLGFHRLSGYSHDLRQRAHGLFCDPSTTKKSNCTPVAYNKECDCECRPDIPIDCSLWREGVTITAHTRRYHRQLREHQFCLAFPGDGWSSRVLDAVVHGCVPVIIQDESEMFFEGAFEAAQLGLDYADFSLRVREADLASLMRILEAVSAERLASLQRGVLRVRDYFVWKDVYNPDGADRRSLLSAGRPGHDGFLLLVAALEDRALRLLRKRPFQRLNLTSFIP